MPAETDTKTVENINTDLSQPNPGELPESLEGAPPAPPTNPENPPPAPEADLRRRNFENAQRRINHKQYKQRIAALNAGDTREEMTQAMLGIAKSKGFDTADEATRKQVELQVEANLESNRILKSKEQSIKAGAAQEILSETLESLGYQKGTKGFDLVGAMLFRSIGVEEPERFADQEFVEKQIETINSVTSKKVKADPVSAAVNAKAGAPRPASESRVKGPAKGTEEPAKKLQEKWPGMDDETAKQIHELQQKQPKWLQTRK